MSDFKRVKVPIMSTSQLMGWLVPRLKKLKEALEGGKLPEKVDSEGIWQCNGYCPFTKFCWPKEVPKASELKKRKKNQKPTPFPKLWKGGKGEQIAGFVPALCSYEDMGKAKAIETYATYAALMLNYPQDIKLILSHRRRLQRC